MKHSNTRKSIVHRILTGALSVVVLLSGLVFAPIPVRAAEGAATTHYTFEASGDWSTDNAKLAANVTYGENSYRHNIFASLSKGYMYDATGIKSGLKVFRIADKVGTDGGSANIPDATYHYGLPYRTYTSSGGTNYKAAKESLAITLQQLTALDTSEIEAANLSMLIAQPINDGLNIPFDRRLEVKVQVNGSDTWLDGSAYIRSCELIGGGVTASDSETLESLFFRIETDNLLDITGVEGNTITGIKVLPEGEDVCSDGYFYINQLLVNTYSSLTDFNEAVPADVIETTLVGGTTLRNIALAEADRVATKMWTTDEPFVSKSPTGSSGVDSNVETVNYKTGTQYRGPVYERNSDATRELFESQLTDSKYTSDELVVTDEYDSNTPYGMDCQAFVYNAISRVSRTSADEVIRTPGATRVSLVGDLEAVNPLPVYTQADVIGAATVSEMYPHYRAAQPGDIAVHWLTTDSSSVHTRLVNKVDGNTIYFTEQASPTPWGFGGIMGSQYNCEYYTCSRTGTESSATFAELLEEGYVIYTLDEYNTGLVENVDVQAVAGSLEAGTHFADSGLNLAVSSNYRVVKHQVKLNSLNANGSVKETLFDSGVLYNPGSNQTGFNYSNTELNNMLMGLANGTYAVTIDVYSGPFTSESQTEVDPVAKTFKFTLDNRIDCNGHSSDDGWKVLSASGEITESGKYYLTEAFSGAITVSSGVTATLCLNGQTISNDAEAIRVNGTLDLCSCAVGGLVTGGSNSQLIFVSSSGVLNLLKNVTVTNNANRGVTVAGQFNMFEGSKITSCAASESGGGVYVGAGSFNMKGGTISDNSSTTGYGGGVHVNGGTFTMEGGTISGNTGKNDSNGVSTGESGIFIMEGGTILSDGGNVVYATGTNDVTLHGGVLSGGNVVAANSTAKITVDGTVSIAETVNSFGTVTINGGTINGMVRARVTGSQAGTVNITGGEIKGTLEEEESPGVFGELVISGGKFCADPMDYLAQDDPYCVKEINESSLNYQVVKGFISMGELFDFSSSLNVSLLLEGENGYKLTDHYDDFEISCGKYSDVKEKIALSGSNTTADVLTIQGIAAKEMHDEITVVVAKDGVPYYTQTLSAFDVAQGWAETSSNEKEKTMLADMINYGIEAQKAFSYNVDDVRQLSVNGITLNGTTKAPTWTATDGAGAPSEFKDKVATALSLKDKVQLVVYVNDAAAEIPGDVKLGGVNYTDYSMAYASGVTRIVFANIDVIDVKDVLEFTVTLADGETSFEMKYSIADYVLKAVAAEGNTQKDLLIAMQKYVDSVCRYLNLNVGWVKPDWNNSETTPFDWDSIVAE